MSIDEPDPVDEEIARLVDLGVLRPRGVTEDGEFTYDFDLDRLEIENPALYQGIMDDTDDALIGLLEADLIDFEYDEDLKPTFTLKEGVELDEGK